MSKHKFKIVYQKFQHSVRSFVDTFNRLQLIICIDFILLYIAIFQAFSSLYHTKLIELSHTIDIQLFLQLVAMHQYIQLTGSWNRNQKNCLHLKHTDVNTFSPRSTFQNLATFSNYLTHSTTVHRSFQIKTVTLY